MQIPYRKPGKYSQQKFDPLLTEEKFKELEKKLAKLKATQPQAAAEVSRLAELGDFSENAEYQLAKGRLRGMNNAMRVLEARLHEAVIISAPTQKDKVQLGSTVSVEANKKISKYTILGSSESSPQRGIISSTSPLGAELMGRRSGDVVLIKLKDKVVEYRVVKIE